jgi:S-adenosylmethionine:tRNA ribosyltransferase-isomerase
VTTADIPAGNRVSDFDYELPPGRIARYPAHRRDESRLMVVDRGDSAIRHLLFRDLPGLLSSGDALVVNESRVLPVRLLGRKPTGAPAEILLLRSWEEAAAGKVWEALVRPGGKLKPGRMVYVDRELTVEILDSTPAGGRIVRLLTEMPVTVALERFGHVPLPPYLEREDEPVDRERYQTVYAQTPGSVAAPTAGLHFTPRLLEELERRGVQRVELTLHVGVGTFRPVEVDDPGQHRMDPERFRISEEAASTLNGVRHSGGRLWAVGTTVVRTLETMADDTGMILPGEGSTDLFIRPPFRFKAVDGLITNFHLPRSTLLMLVAAFAGYRRTLGAYTEAIREGYRFYSYGDAMVIV